MCRTMCRVILMEGCISKVWEISYIVGSAKVGKYNIASCVWEVTTHLSGTGGILEFFQRPFSFIPDDWNRSVEVLFKLHFQQWHTVIHLLNN
jgi:hypothetical protein